MSSDVVEAEATSTPEADTTKTPAVAAKPQEGEATKAGETETKEGKVEAKPDASKPAEPEKQTELAFTTPEGQPIKGPVIEAFTEMAKGQKWTQEVASEHLGRLSQSMRDARTALAVEWEKELRADKEVGGDKFDEHIGQVKAAVERIAGAEYFESLVASGLERHPPTVRAWLKVAKAIAPDKFIAGVKVTGRPGDIVNPADTSVAAFKRAAERDAKQ